MNEINWSSKWTKEQIKSILIDQSEIFWKQDPGVERTQLSRIEQLVDVPHAVIISGLRRVGKSTLLNQVARKLGRERFYYINFEDDRMIGFQVDDANYLYELMVETFGERKIFIIDEIQNVKGWEHFVRRFMDMGYKFLITGSNASLLSRELGTRLTGRYVPIELYPFTFQEYFTFQGKKIPNLSHLTTTQKATLNNMLVEYLERGGIPDALKYPELQFLQTLYDDVLYRDIATRYRIEAVTALRELAFFLVSNSANAVTFNKLKQQFGLGSVNTIKSYIDYLENSWLLFTVNLYDYSVKRQQLAPKKVYCIDTGLATEVGFAFSPNRGRLLENLVFLALRRKTKDVYYLTSPNGYEIDFFLPEKGLIVQVAEHMKNPETREREIRSIKDIIDQNRIRQGLILAHTNEDPIEVGDKLIEIRSLSEWLVEQD